MRIWSISGHMMSEFEIILLSGLLDTTFFTRSWSIAALIRSGISYLFLDLVRHEVHLHDMCLSMNT